MSNTLGPTRWAFFVLRRWWFFQRLCRGEHVPALRPLPGASAPRPALAARIPRTHVAAVAPRGVGPRTVCRIDPGPVRRAFPAAGARALVQGALDLAGAAQTRHVRIDECRRDVAVAEEFLDRPDVVARLEQVGREGMAKGVTRRGLSRCAAARTAIANSRRTTASWMGGRRSLPVCRSTPCGLPETPIASPTPSAMRIGSRVESWTGGAPATPASRSLECWALTRSRCARSGATRRLGSSVRRSLSPLPPRTVRPGPQQVDVADAKPAALMEAQAGAVHERDHEAAARRGAC